VSNLDTILTYLQTQLGLSPAQAAGVAGNLQVESGFNPAAYNAGEGAIGIAQWEGGRRQALDAFAAQAGSSETDLGTQLGFLVKELHGPESGAYQQLLATSDPGSAAAAFDQYYERSSGGSRATRIADAQAIAGGNAGGSGGSGGSSSGGSGQSVASSIGGITGSAFTVGIKILGAAAAAGLVIVGATRTVSSR
jgi:hypothetical protein